MMEKHNFRMKVIRKKNRFQILIWFESTFNIINYDLLQAERTFKNLLRSLMENMPRLYYRQGR